MVPLFTFRNPQDKQGVLAFDGDQIVYAGALSISEAAELMFREFGDKLNWELLHTMAELAVENRRLRALLEEKG